MIKLFTYLLISFLFVINNSIVIAQTQTESVAPNWVNKRPVNSFKFIGIGVADKSAGNNYQNEAKKNALFDLSSEIKVDISSNSILYTVQNNNQFNENFNSLIKLSSTDNIEGYKLVDAYENDKQYWLYYELDKQDYENQKAKTKELTIAKAVNLINVSFTDEKEGNFAGSLKKRIQAFGVLSPYLNEDLSFTTNNNVKNIIELSNTIQKQLQTISVITSKTNQVIKPYQPSYKPISYKLVVNNKSPLVDFPFIVNSDNENVRINEASVTNSNGDIEINIKSVKPLNQEIYFTLNPDINKLMNGDSVSKSSIILLKQFIETAQLKAYAKVSPISIFINCIEKNGSKLNDQKIIEPIIISKFQGQEIAIVEQKEKADYLIDVEALTFKDVSSDILNANYSIQLSQLKIKLSLRNVSTKELLYNSEVSDIYGYGNSQETAGLNAFQSDKLKAKLNENLFFLKRKMINY
jgi:hypothetical protein